VVQQPLHGARVPSFGEQVQRAGVRCCVDAALGEKPRGRGIIVQDEGTE
jgi:hypothetical protein